MRESGVAELSINGYSKRCKLTFLSFFFLGLLYDKSQTACQSVENSWLIQDLQSLIDSGSMA